MVEKSTVIAAIGAVARNGMLGLDHWLPWDIPEELAYFERTVAGAALVIGRLTYESMGVVPEDAFIVTRQPDYLPRPGCTAVASVEAGLHAAIATGKPVFVIGGAAIYAAAWPYCRYFYLTRIDRDFAGDTLFPEDVPVDAWPIVAAHEAMLAEHKTGELVRCCFLKYEQPNPRPLTAAPSF